MLGRERLRGHHSLGSAFCAVRTQAHCLSLAGGPTTQQNPVVSGFPPGASGDWATSTASATIPVPRDVLILSWSSGSLRCDDDANGRDLGAVVVGLAVLVVVGSIDAEFG
jgi:hypothetical protein